MEIKAPYINIHVEFNCSPTDAAVIADDAQRIINEEHSEAVGELSSQFKKLLEVLTGLSE